MIIMLNIIFYLFMFILIKADCLFLIDVIVNEGLDFISLDKVSEEYTCTTI